MGTPKAEPEKSACNQHPRLSPPKADRDHNPAPINRGKGEGVTECRSNVPNGYPQRKRRTSPAEAEDIPSGSKGHPEALEG